MKRLIVPLIVLVLLSLACQLTPTADPTPVPTEPLISSAEQVVPTLERPTEIPTPTEVPTSEATMPVDEETNAQGDYHEEFDEQTDNWTFDFVTGNTQKTAQIFTEAGQLKIKLDPKEEAHLKIFENNHKTYRDVVVSTEFTSLGATNNGVSLLCRVNSDGWYEFRISNSGLFSIFRYDTALKDAGKNPYILIAQGGSPFIKTGTKTNTFAMSCGDQFRFFINEQEIKKDKLRIPTTLMNEFKKYPEGGVGLGVYAWNDTPSMVDIQFEYFDAKVPQ